MAKREPHLLYGLPKEVIKKINKTKQTRGAQPYDRVVYQNRVNRNGIAIVPYAFRDKIIPGGFENGYVIMVRPKEYFVEPGQQRPDFDSGIKVGSNAFVYYDNRYYYDKFPPLKSWKPRRRGGPGEMVFRLPATTAKDEGQAAKKVSGDPQGIRFYEYASSEEYTKVVVQLAMLAWTTEGIDEVREDEQESGAPAHLEKAASELSLWDVPRLRKLGVLGEGGKAVCPLCKAAIKAKELMSRVVQAEGREVYDLTITEVNLFHMEDLKPGEYNHRAYCVGWGHYHCNIVARDRGIPTTLTWMADVLRRNGYRVES